MNRCVLFGLLTMVSGPGAPLHLRFRSGSTAKTATKDYPVVFRGNVLERKLLPQHIEMKGRRRDAITFRVDEYWKGSPDRTRVLHGLDDGTDCLGDGGYELGKDYLCVRWRASLRKIAFGGCVWFG